MSERLSERWERLVEKGARREVERRRTTREFFGEGGTRLSQREKLQLFEQQALDPTGEGMTDTLRRRQAANKMEGTADIPADWWTWCKLMTEKMQGHPVGED